MGFSSLDNPGTKPLPYGSTAKDYTGMYIGTLFVVGHYGYSPVKYSRNGRKRHIRSRIMWVVRCDCGRYELRSTKTLSDCIRKPTKMSMCHKCVKEHRKDISWRKSLINPKGANDA